MKLPLFLPGLIAALILLAGTPGIPLLEPLRTESTYGWWVVVLYPLAALLAASQVVLWILWTVRWAVRRHAPDGGRATGPS